MVFTDPQGFSLKSGKRDNKIIAAVGQPEVEAAVIFGQRPDRGVLTEDGCPTKGLAGGIDDLSIHGEGLGLGKNG
jgi:hypothetical protein